MLEAVGSLEAGDWGGWGQLGGGVQDIQELLVDLVVRRAGAVLLSLVPDVHGLDVEVARPLLAGTTAGRVSQGGAAAAGQSRGGDISRRAGGAEAGCVVMAGQTAGQALTRSGPGYSASSKHYSSIYRPPPASPALHCFSSTCLSKLSVFLSD